MSVMTAMGMRSFRCDQPTWDAAKRVAYERDADLSDALRGFLRRYAEEETWTV